MQKPDIKVIVFDLDGTLYDLHDVYSMQYGMQIEYLSAFLGIDEQGAIEILSNYGIDDEPSSTSASATALFHAIGIDNSDWNKYREKNFDVNEIVKKRAVDPTIISRFSRIAPLVLLTRTGYKVIYSILDHIGIDRNAFDLIICPETEGFAGEIFSKTKAFENIAAHYGISCENMVSIGDRYYVDVEPLIKLGGRGYVNTKPKHLKNILEQLENQ